MLRRIDVKPATKVVWRHAQHDFIKHLEAECDWATKHAGQAEDVRLGKFLLEERNFNSTDLSVEKAQSRQEMLPEWQLAVSITSRINHRRREIVAMCFPAGCNQQVCWHACAAVGRDRPLLVCR